MRFPSIPLAACVAAALAVARPAVAQTAQGPAPTPGAAAVIDRAVAAYAKVRTARGTFEQTITNPVTGSTAVARGEFQQQRPGRMAVRFTEPKGDRIVADGKAVWVYLPSTNPGQVIKVPASRTGTGTVDLTSQFLDEPKTRYTITEAGAGRVGGRATHALTLVPRTPQPFTKATVWVDDADGSVRQFEVADGSGVVRRVTLRSLRVNVKVDAGAFRFSPPAGVRVVEQGLTQ
ncbi:MAG TPA: outer membrane lipoprotein carrier protein LolA [Gemmatimonadaceae bacterium]|nr:outer membrane lipoprotein carrier protein LolA [Gemmatimonadaceae bacterium]